MNSIAVGDLFIPAGWMKDALEEGMGAKVKAFEWGPGDKPEMRRVIQELEHGGAEAVPWPQEIVPEIADAELLMVHLAPVPRTLLEQAPKLRLIASTRGGVENVDVAAASERGVAVISNPAHNANAVAELTVGLMIAETRNIVRSHSSLRSGSWREEYPLSGAIPELRGSTIGIVGFGSIGRRVAALLEGFGAKLLVHDPYVDPEKIRRMGLTPCSLPELLSRSRIVSVHARVPPDAAPLIGEAELKQMQSESYLINTARAGVLDMKALREALLAKEIAGAALDVFDVEPLPSDDPLCRLDRVTLTNHRGSDTLNSYADSPAMVVAEAKRFFAGETPAFLANPQQFPELEQR